MTSKGLFTVHSRHVGSQKKREKGNREKKGITDPRNSLAISIHPNGCHTYVRWKDFGDSALQERGTEGVAKEFLVHGRSTPAMRHIDFIFIPDRFPRRVREEVSVLKERFHPPLISSPTSTSDENETDLRFKLKVSFNREICHDVFSYALQAENNVSGQR